MEINLEGDLGEIVLALLLKVKWSWRQMYKDRVVKHYQSGNVRRLVYRGMGSKPIY